MNGSQILLFVIGIYLICAAIFNWEWFYGMRKARFIVSLFGRKGARLFYLILGLIGLIAPFFIN
ncbi:MAG: hypothetical protein F6K40_09190 [Okeania sp. SIO3I5]|uniref:immunity 17 family protein n=1 Tax=Okeania sp. SIO3I5 TaxID=2607805 RepID=UPI0013B79D84|nr:immunity 17 family protein [Okeania sp. SIO3I5]NEQ36439.1 hypothetical protein [Okeania sp. SIO3I5]